MSRYFTGFVVSDHGGAMLEKMLVSGLWGESEAEMLTHICLVAVQRAVADGLIAPPQTEAEEDPEADPPAAPYKCEHCRDGANSMPEGMTAGGKCPKCGADCEIPF